MPPSNTNNPRIIHCPITSRVYIREDHPMAVYGLPHEKVIRDMGYRYFVLSPDQFLKSQPHIQPSPHLR